MTTNVSNSPKFPCVDCNTDCCKEYTIFVNAMMFIDFQMV